MTESSGSCAAAVRTTVGAICWIAAPLLFLGAHLVTQIAWPEPYSWANHNISDLGNVGCGVFEGRPVCSPWHQLFNASVVATGVLLAAGLVLSWSRWGRGPVVTLARCCLLLASAGYVLAGLRPADVDLDLHVLGAVLVMPVANLGLVLAGFAHRGSPVGRIRVVSLALGIVAFAATYLHFAGPWFGLGRGGMERIAVFALLAWVGLVGLVLLRSIRPATPATMERSRT